MVDIPSFYDIFKPDNPIIIAVLVGMAVGAFFLVRFITRLREPEGKKIDKFVFCMPDPGELFKGTVYEHPDAKDKVKLDLLASFKETKPVADILIQYWDKIFAYVVKYESMSESTISNGYAILLTHDKLDDPKLGGRLKSHLELLTGQRAHTRLLCQASEYGGIFDNMGEYDGKPADLIYYPVMRTHIEPNAKVTCPKCSEVFDDSKLTVLQNPHSALSLIAIMKQAVANFSKQRELEAKIKAYEQTTTLAVSEIKRQTSRRGLVEIENAKKSPFPGTEVERPNAALSTAVVVIIMIGSVIVFPPLIKGIFPQFDDATVRTVAVILGGVGVFFATRFFTFR